MRCGAAGGAGEGFYGGGVGLSADGGAEAGGSALYACWMVVLSVVRVFV